LAGVAVNVTLVPAQTVLPGDAAMFTDGARKAFTVIVIALEVAVADVTQVTDDVITQAITSPLASDALEYVSLLVPTLFPFSFH